MSRHLSLCVAVGIACAAMLASSPAEAAKKRRPVPCPGGRFVIDGARLSGDAALGNDAVVIGAGTAATDSGCAPAKAKVTANRKFTAVVAKWTGCAGLAGKAIFTGRIDAATCRSLTGTFVAKKSKVKRKLTAHVQGAPAFTLSAFTPALLPANTVGPAGGTLTVTDPGNPLYGLMIEVPAGATDEVITFHVEWAEVEGVNGLPAGATTASKLIRITAEGSAEWNQYRMFTHPVRVTLPYVAPPEAEESVRFYVLNADGTLEAAGLEGQDLANHRLTFFTSVFGDTAEPSQFASAAGVLAPAPQSATTTFMSYVAVGLGQVLTAMLTGGTVVDTGFRPSANGWYIPNYGSYYKFSRGGNCFGFVGAAKWYFGKRFAPTLYPTYHDARNTPTWVDDAVAIEFTSRVHNAMSEIWDAFTTNEVHLQTPSGRQVALSYLGGLYVTGTPVLLYIQQAIAQMGGTVFSGAHAISIYRADVSGGTISFWVYDPNFPGPKSDPRRITYTLAGGFQTYDSGTDAGSSSYHYNYFKHVGYHVGVSDAALEAIKRGADGGYADTIFPKVTITSITGVNTGNAATEGTTATGEHKYVVDDNAIRIEGTILGGLAQDACCVVNNARLFLSNKRYSANVNNVAGGGDGTFVAVVPIGQGENDFVVLAAKKNSFSHWAAFLRDVIESTASPAALTITLSWGQGESDVDLYVKEPDGDGGKIGDTVYYSHRRGGSATNPYLDLDNTRGYGPEHYIGKPGMKTLYTDASAAPSLYGEYTVKAHYYSDHDSNSDEYQPISWNIEWEYLAFCPDPCANPDTDGIWQNGGASGSLSAASSGNCCNIGHAGADWTEAMTIDYQPPDPSEWVIPPPPGVMLP